MQPTIATITFLQNGVSRTLDLLSDDTLSFFTKHMDFDEEYVRVVLEPKKAVEISEIKMQFPCTFEREDSIFMNGFQSWTVCKEYNIDTTKAVMEQMTKVSKNTSKEPQRPCSTGWAVLAEAWIMGEVPQPASLE